ARLVMLLAGAVVAAAIALLVGVRGGEPPVRSDEHAASRAISDAASVRATDRPASPPASAATGPAASPHDAAVAHVDRDALLVALRDSGSGTDVWTDAGTALLAAI